MDKFEKFDKCLNYIKENCVQLTDLEMYQNMINHEEIHKIPKEDYNLVMSTINNVWLKAGTNSIAICSDAVIENWEEIEEENMRTSEIIENYII